MVRGIAIRYGFVAEVESLGFHFRSVRASLFNYAFQKLLSAHGNSMNVPLKFDNKNAIKQDSSTSTTTQW